MFFTFNPLKFPKLRQYGLASVKGAMFGMTRNNGTKAHQGIDFEIENKYRIYAVENCKVVYIGNQPNGHGLCVIIKLNCPNKKCIHNTFALYSHLSRIDVKVGYCYNAGHILGLTGCSGNAKGMSSIKTGAHLHFELRTLIFAGYGLKNRINPLPFIDFPPSPRGFF